MRLVEIALHAFLIRFADPFATNFSQLLVVPGFPMECTDVLDTFESNMGAARLRVTFDRQRGEGGRFAIGFRALRFLRRFADRESLFVGVWIFMDAGLANGFLQSGRCTGVRARFGFRLRGGSSLVGQKD